MKDDRQKSSIVGWSGLIWALVFLMNPDIGIFDILPDFIGYILFCVSIAKIADIDDRVNEARGLLQKMLYVGIAKFLALFVIFGLLPPTDRSVGMLLFAFVFTVFELVYLLPAIVKLTDGIIYLSVRHEGTAAYTPSVRTIKHGYKRTITEKVRRLSIIFVIAKAVCRTLPEFASLTEQTFDGTARSSLYLYTDLFRALAIIVELVFMLIWFILTVRYIKLIKRDTVFIGNLEQQYDAEIRSKPDRPARRAIKAAFFCFGAAVILTPDLYFDGINILPDTLSALSVILGLWIVRKFIKGWQKVTVIASVYAAVSAVALFLDYKFRFEFYPESILRDIKAYNLYAAYCGVRGVSELVFVVLVFALLWIIMKNIITGHTGFVAVGALDQSEKIRVLHEELSKRLIIPAVFAGLSALTDIVSMFLINTADFVWLIEFLVSALFAFFMIRLMMGIDEQIEYKYMLA
ncbi:MAG TPA: hypothetical protein PKN17_00095 [Bacillota bacterium]|nr:hypothetical protein [Bacillota bacterium]